MKHKFIYVSVFWGKLLWTHEYKIAFELSTRIATYPKLMFMMTMLQLSVCQTSLTAKKTTIKVNHISNFEVSLAKFCRTKPWVY